MARVNPIIAVGCGVSADLSAALSSVDNLITDILNGIGDITGAIADAVSSALDAVGVALGKMLPDLSGLIPNISFSAGIESLLDLVEGSLEYAAKLAQLIFQFGESILSAGLNIFDMIADAASAFLKGLNPCGALASDFSAAPDGSVVAKEIKAQFAKGEKAGLVEAKANVPIFTKVNKDKSVASLGTATPTSLGGSGLQSNVTSTVQQIASTSASDVGNLRAKPQNIYGGGGLQSTPTQIPSTKPTLDELLDEVLSTDNKDTQSHKYGGPVTQPRNLDLRLPSVKIPEIPTRFSKQNRNPPEYFRSGKIKLTENDFKTIEEFYVWYDTLTEGEKFEITPSV